MSGHPLAVHSHNTKSAAICFISRGRIQNQNGLAESDSPLWSFVIFNKPLQFAALLQKNIDSVLFYFTDVLS